MQAVIDRLEQDKAVILLGEDEQQVLWPLSKLPLKAQEGDILQIDVIIDEAATKQAREDAEALLQEIIKNQAE